MEGQINNTHEADQFFVYLANLVQDSFSKVDSVFREDMDAWAKEEIKVLSYYGTEAATKFCAAQKAIRERRLERQLKTLKRWEKEAQKKGFNDLQGWPEILGEIRRQINDCIQTKSMGTARKRRTAPIREAAEIIASRLQMHNVPRYPFWAAGVLWHSGIPGIEVGIPVHQDLIFIYEDQKTNVAKLHSIESTINQMIATHKTDTLASIPDEDRRQRLEEALRPTRTQRLQWWKQEKGSNET
tara:strand:+ start:783 stop:1508 length:726 start_codon:yes stop_codon:yes gene_type:complete